MVFALDPGQMKIAEKLVILNDRAIGLLTRVYNIKKACAEPKSKPAFLADKSVESALKHIVKKFPVTDARTNPGAYSNVAGLKDQIIASLSHYYYTFADLLEFKDHVLQLLTTMDAAQCHLDIALNYELTTGYLNLVVNLISAMILLSRVDDRKAVLGLFNAAHELANGQTEASFPRLGQMILDYESPLKKLSEELTPLNRLMLSALSSMSPVFTRRNISAASWRTAQILSLTTNPQQMVYVAQTDTIASEYLSLDAMERWVILTCTVCHGALLNDPLIVRMWQLSLQGSLAIRVFRDEILIIHPALQTFFESFKGLNKRVQEIKDAYAIALAQCASLHGDRRKFLRGALRELTLLIHDEPGLLGPKILFVWMALSFSRDEVLWLLRHHDIWPSTKKKDGSKAEKAEELVDKQLPELLHYMEELRDLVRKHAGIIQRYYMTYIGNYDVAAIGELMNGLKGLSKDDNELIQDFMRDISSLNAEVSFRALRLDWCRFQAHVSISRSPFQLSAHQPFAVAMNTAVFHLRMVDLLEETLRETSDLSIYCFYVRHLERQWRLCMTMPNSCRYSMAFARICSHFPYAIHEMCPEEKTHIIERSLALADQILSDLCATTGGIIGDLCDDELRLTELTTPIHVAQQIQMQVLNSQQQGKKAQKLVQDFPLAGAESKRRDRCQLSIQDKRQTILVELASAFTAVRNFTVAEHIFSPTEYLFQQLETKFAEMIINAATQTPTLPRRPSELLSILDCYMTVLSNVDTLVAFDVQTLMRNVLLQQTQPLDSKNRKTVTSIYTKWYLEVVLHRAATGNLVWSDHLKAMISGGEQSEFAPEQYTDPAEMQALCQLLSPYGIKHLTERLVWHVASQIGELEKLICAEPKIQEGLYQLVIQNKDPRHFDKTELIREVAHELAIEPKEKKGQSSTTTAADAILQRTSIIGQIFSFRDALHDALKEVLARPLTLILRCYRFMDAGLPDEVRAGLSELGEALGEKTVVDMALVNALRAQSTFPPDEHYTVSRLLMAAIAIALPRIAENPLSIYKPSIRAALNNSHCIPLAIVTIGPALFFLHGRGDIEVRMMEFLALATASSLRLAEDEEAKRPPEPIVNPLDLTDDDEEDQARSRKERARGLERDPIAYLSILLDKVVVGSSSLHYKAFDHLYPYAMSRNAYLDAYEKELSHIEG
ncbi:unnamed protein product, partial [Mesorhabditis spiculigera]